MTGIPFSRGFPNPGIELGSPALQADSSTTELCGSLSLFTFMHWRRKWQPTPVFLPGAQAPCPNLDQRREGSGRHPYGHAPRPEGIFHGYCAPAPPRGQILLQECRGFCMWLGWLQALSFTWLWKFQPRFLLRNLNNTLLCPLGPAITGSSL